MQIIRNIAQDLHNVIKYKQVLEANLFFPLLIFILKNVNNKSIQKRVHFQSAFFQRKCLKVINFIMEKEENTCK